MLLSEVACLGKKNFELQPAQINTISKKIEQAHQFHAPRNGGRIRFRHIRRTLLGSPEPIAKELGQSLGMFTDDGVFAGFFDGSEDSLIPPGARFCCFEVSALSEHKEVLTPLSLMLFHKITRYFESLPTNIPKLLVIEEAWMLLESTRTSEYVAHKQRTYRKLTGGVVIVSQHARDLDNAAGRAILGDKVNLLLLRHQPQEAADTAEFLKLTHEQHQALGALSGRPGYYSDILVLAPNIQGVVRLILGPHNYWYLTSDGQDLAAIEEERAAMASELGQEPQLQPLLDRLAQKYPFGRMHT